MGCGWVFRARNVFRWITYCKRNIWTIRQLGETSKKQSSYVFNFKFDYDSGEVIYLIICDKCCEIYLVSTITSFRYRSNNHTSSATRYGKGGRRISGEYLYASFLVQVMKEWMMCGWNLLIKRMLWNQAEERPFWAYKLKSFIPRGLNFKDFVWSNFVISNLMLYKQHRHSVNW